MVSTVCAVLGALIAYSAFSILSSLRANIAAARQTDLRFVVTPVSPFNRLWQVTSGVWTPMIKLLPKSWWQDWIDVMQPNSAFFYLRQPFERLGDNFLVVSPGHIILFTSSADTIHQITSRRESFPKPTQEYQILALFGRNVLTTEGAVWRLHRKATSASFNERNAAHTFAEAVRQTQGMIETWLGPDGTPAARTITSLEHDTMTLALNIIGYVGFGLRFLWPGQMLPADVDPRLKKYASFDPPEGHTMTFAKSLATVLEKIFALLLLPRWLIKIIPAKWARVTLEATENYVQYMQEFIQDKAEQVRAGDRGEGGMDIMGQLVRSTYSGGKDTKKDDKQANGNSKSSSSSAPAVTAQPQLTDAEIIGNAFIMIVAGHETTANTLHFTLLHLACHPAAQRALQADVDRLLGRDSDPRCWGYEQSVAAMLASHLGASVNETLRLMPPVTEVPKCVAPGRGCQEVAVEGARRALPPGTQIVLSVVNVQRNPRYWPRAPGAAEDDLDDYVPERWFRKSGSEATVAVAAAERDSTGDEESEEDYGGYAGPDTSAQLFRPAPGSFIPFSEGARSCLGRRIAQVEMVAALAVVFQRYSVELAVDEWAGEEEVARMGREEKSRVYERARGKAKETLRSASSLLTLKLQGGRFVPVRLVRRGEERFVGVVDS